jgi:D-alanine-D-alanine ligase
MSGTAIAQALAEAGESVEQRYIDLDGGWWRMPAEHRRAGRGGAAYDDPRSLGGRGPEPIGAAVDELATASPPPVVFVALHGPFGEDGRIQGVLEAAGVAYTGPGVAASALGMDKVLFKRLCRGLGLPVTDWRDIRADRWARDRDNVLGELEAFAAANGDPRLMIKPARLGSSVGMTLAHDPTERGPALDLAFRYDTLALAEPYIAGARDLEVSVIGNDPARLELFGPGEIVAGHEFYDFEAKYIDDTCEYDIPAHLPEPVTRRIQEYARRIFTALDCAGLARVDFFVSGADEVYLNEINTMPGFTSTSMFPRMWAATGLEYPKLISRLIRTALRRGTGLH